MPRSGEGPAIEGAKADRVSSAAIRPVFEKLKPGPGLPPEQVSADQKRRLHGATIALVGRDGCDGLRVRSVARAAGVSTSTFYKHFVNADACIGSAYDSVVAEIMHRAAAAQARSPDWRTSLRATAARILEDLTDEPKSARFALVDIFSARPPARERIGHGIDNLERLLSVSFAEAPKALIPPRHLIAGMTAGIIRVARKTILAGRTGELPDLVGVLGDWLESLPSPEVSSLRTAATVRGFRRESHPFPDGITRKRDRDFGDDRERLLRTVIKLTTLEGLSELTVPRLRREAGVSRRYFDSHFESVDDCFLAGIESISEEAASQALSWGDHRADWKQQICRFSIAMCAQAARNRTDAHLVLLGGLMAGKTGLLRRERMIERLAAGLKDLIPPEIAGPPLYAEASVAAVWHIAQSDLAAGRSSSLPSLAPLLSYLVLAPLIGARDASVSVRASMQTSA